MNLFALALVAYPWVPLTVGAPHKDCKVVPGEAGWPSKASWASLNHTVDGRLIASVPVFAVCHPSRAEFNKKACEAIKHKRIISSFIANQPIETDYNDEGCLPDPKYPCKNDAYPVYVVNATRAAHVQHAVNFARKHKVRLVVKGTGHDFNIRSTGRHSLSIWTHHMKEFEVHEQFTPFDCDCSHSHPAVTVGAGYQMRDLIGDLAKYHRVAVGGSDPDVGIGGFLSAGGHSPISSVYGLGADQILEMKVVTAGGEFLTINENCHADLFWAVRGGGPSHAVMVSVTLKTFPTSSVGQIFYQLNSSTQEHFWDIITYLHTQVPTISDGGLAGYYYPVNLGSAGGTIAGIWIALNKTQAEMNKVLSKFLSYAKKTPTTKYVSYKANFKTFADYNAAVPPETVGSFARLGSRLLDRNTLTGNKTALKRALIKATPPGTELIGHVVAGKGVANAKIVGGSDSVLPAWRRAYLHLVAPAGWKPFDKSLEHKEWSDLTNVRGKALVDLDPTSGSYVNEGDPHEPDWQHTFWGSNYPRLFEIKNKWDPEGVFYCFPCVGAEEWEHINGTLCRA